MKEETEVAPTQCGAGGMVEEGAYNSFIAIWAQASASARA